MIVAEGREEDEKEAKIIAERIPSFPKEGFKDYLGKDKLFLVLKENDLLLGFACLSLEGEEAELDYIALSLSEEGKGKASYLLQEVFRILQEKNVKRLLLEVRSQNQRAIKLYERNGFSAYRIRKNYYPNDNAICYERRIEE